MAWVVSPISVCIVDQRWLFFPGTSYETVFFPILVVCATWLRYFPSSNMPKNSNKGFKSSNRILKIKPRLQTLCVSVPLVLIMLLYREAIRVCDIAGRQWGFRDSVWAPLQTGWWPVQSNVIWPLCYWDSQILQQMTPVFSLVALSDVSWQWEE